MKIMKYIHFTYDVGRIILYMTENSKILFLNFSAGGRQMKTDGKHTRPMTLPAALHLAAPHTWPAAVLPVLLGTALAAADGEAMRPWIALCVLAVAVLLQSAVNTLNDYRDFVSGLDSADNCTDESDAALLYDGCTPKGALALGFAFLLCAAILGGVLVASCGASLLIYGALALLAILLYVLPGVSFSGLPLGELLSGGAMGGVLTCAAYHAQTGRFSPALLYLCLPAVVTIGCILLVNNASDIEKDAPGGRKTLSVCIGRKASTTLLRTALAAAALGVFVILLLRYPRGAAAVPVLPIALLTSGGVRGLFTRPLTPENRRENMCGVLAAHKWIIGCYAAALALHAMM